MLKTSNLSKLIACVVIVIDEPNPVEFIVPVVKVTAEINEIKNKDKAKAKKIKLRFFFVFCYLSFYPGIKRANVVFEAQ